MIITILCCLAILHWSVMRPVARRRHAVMIEDLRRTHLLFKIKTVHQHREELRDLSYRQIIHHYNLDQAYDGIGRPRHLQRRKDVL